MHQRVGTSPTPRASQASQTHSPQNSWWAAGATYHGAGLAQAGGSIPRLLAHGSGLARGW